MVPPVDTAAVEVRISARANENASARKLAGRVPVAGSPFDMVATGNGEMCVTRLHSAAIDCLQFRPPSLGVVGQIATGPVPTRFVCSTRDRRGYVSLQFADQVGVIDLARHRQMGFIPVPGNPLGTDLSRDGRTLFVTTNLDLLCRVDTALGRVTRACAIPHAGFGIASHPSAPLLYVSTWNAGSILELDTRTLEITRVFKVGGAVQDLVIASGDLVLYATNERGWLDVIQLRTGRPVVRVDLASPAISLALSPDGHFLYAGLTFVGSVVVLDRRTLATVATLKTGGKPRGIAFDPTTGVGFIANEKGWVDLVV